MANPSDVGGLQFKLVALNDQYEAEKALTRHKEQEIQRWKETTKALQDELSELNRKVKGMEAAMEAKHEENCALKENIKGLEMRIKYMQQEYKDANNKLKTFEKRAEDATAEITQISDELFKAKSDKKIMADNLRSMEHTHNCAVSELKEERDSKKSLLQESMKSQEEIRSLRNRLIQLRESYSDADKLGEELARVGNAMATLRVQKEAEEKKRQHEVAALESQLVGTQKELESRLEELTNIKHESESYQTKYLEAKMELKMKSSDFEEKDQEYQKWYNSEREQLKRKLQAVREKATEAEAKHSEILQELIKLQDVLHSKDVEIKMLNSKIEHDRDEQLRLRLREQEVLSEKQDMQGELRRLSGVSSNLEKEIESKVVELRRQIATYEVQLRDAQKQMEEDSRHKRELNKTIKDLKSQASGAEERAKSLEHLSGVIAEETSFHRKRAEDLALASVDDITAIERQVIASKREQAALRKQTRLARLDEKAAKAEMFTMQKKHWGETAQLIQAKKRADLYELETERLRKQCEALQKRLYEQSSALIEAERVVAREKAHAEMLSRDLNKYNHDLKKKVQILERKIKGQEEEYFEAKQAQKYAEEGFIKLKAQTNEALDNMMSQMKNNENEMKKAQDVARKEQSVWKAQSREVEKNMRQLRLDSEAQMHKYQNDMKVQKQLLGSVKAELDQAKIILKIKEDELERLMSQINRDCLASDQNDLNRISELEAIVLAREQDLSKLKQETAEYLDFKRREEEKGAAEKQRIELELDRINSHRQRKLQGIGLLQRKYLEDEDMENEFQHQQTVHRTNSQKETIEQHKRKKNDKNRTKKNNNSMPSTSFDTEKSNIRRDTTDSTTFFLPNIA